MQRRAHGWRGIIARRFWPFFVGTGTVSVVAAG
jgi:hypothetical protein